MNLQAFKDGAIDSPGTLVTLTAAGTVIGIGARATGTATLSGQPTAGDTITLNNGTSDYVFEFDGTGGNINVTIGASKEATMANFVTAVNSDGHFIATAHDPADAGCDLQQLLHGTVGNVTITKSGANIAVTGFTGGGVGNIIVVTEDLSAALSPGYKIVVTAGTGVGEVYTVVTAVYDTDHTDITVTEAIGSVIATDAIDQTVAAGTGDRVDLNGKTLTASTALTLADLIENSSGGSLTTSEDIELTAGIDAVSSLVLTSGAVCTISGTASTDGNIIGDCTFSGVGSINYGTITGDCEFSGDGSYNSGDITGDCTFSGDGSYNSGDITGTITLAGPNVYLDAGSTITGCRVEIAAQPDLATANILTGKTILGVAGSQPTTATTQAADAGILELRKDELLAGDPVVFGASSVTGTLPVARVMQANGGNILPSDVLTTGTGVGAGGIYVQPVQADVKRPADGGTAYGPASGTDGTLDIEADNPPIGNQGLAMGL